MDKESLNNHNDSDNELDKGFIADESKQPPSDFLSFSEDRSISGISFLNTPNYTCFSNNDPQISGLESWPQQNIQPFKICPKRSSSIRQEDQNYQDEQPTQKYTKKRINEKMKIVDIKLNVPVSSSNYNSYCLRRKKRDISYVEPNSDQESERNELRMLVSEIKERPITRSFKKSENQKET